LSENIRRRKSPAGQQSGGPPGVFTLEAAGGTGLKLNGDLYIRQ